MFIDTETSGLPKDRSQPSTDVDNWPKVIQIAWKIGDDHSPSDDKVVNHLVYPTFREPMNGEHVHGISRQDIRKKGKNIVDVLHLLNDALDQVDAVVAHNTEFDVLVLLAEFHRYGIPTSLSKKPMFDTMRVNGQWLSLQKCYAKYVETNVDNIQWHDAEGDVKACEACFYALRKKQLIHLYDFCE